MLDCRDTEMNEYKLVLTSEEFESFSPFVLTNFYSHVGVSYGSEMSHLNQLLVFFGSE